MKKISVGLYIMIIIVSLLPFETGSITTFYGSTIIPLFIFIIPGLLNLKITSIKYTPNKTKEILTKLFIMVGIIYIVINIGSFVLQKLIKYKMVNFNQ
jgi:hypothetical protein